MTETEADDLLWVRAAARDDPQAFARLFDRHATSVANYCAYRNGTFRDAEDLTSMVFLEAWRGRHRLEVRGDTAIPLLFGIAAHVCSHHRRSTGRAARALALMPPPIPEADPEDLICARVDAERDATAIAAALDELSVDHRAIVELCVVAELTPAQAADALGIPAGTAKSRLSRAKAVLRDTLAELAHNTGGRP